MNIFKDEPEKFTWCKIQRLYGDTLTWTVAFYIGNREFVTIASPTTVEKVTCEGEWEPVNFSESNLI